MKNLFKKNNEIKKVLIKLTKIRPSQEKIQIPSILAKKEKSKSVFAKIKSPKSSISTININKQNIIKKAENIVQK